MALLALVVLLPLLVIALVPLSLIQRFRRGTAARPARGWVITANLIGVSVSLALFLLSALIASTWSPDALPYTVGGVAAGGLLGLIGMALTRWDERGGRLHYTPNRWLVLAVTLGITARVVYGFWRMGVAWRASAEQMAWVAAPGLATSMSAGAVVLGYYVVYWAAIRRRLRRARHA